MREHLECSRFYAVERVTMTTHLDSIKAKLKQLRFESKQLEAIQGVKV